MNSTIILQRTNDFTYVFKNKNDEIFSVELPKSHNAEFNYNLALKAAKKILESDNKSRCVRYRLGKKNWKIAKAGKISRFIQFLSKIFDFFHPKGDDGIIRYKVGRSFFKGRKSKKDPKTPYELKIKNILRKQFKHSIERSNFKNYITHTGRKVTNNAIQDFKNKVRHSVKIENDVLDFTSPFFEDPFSNLATVAFQKYEKEFTSKDHFVPEYCQYRIVKAGNHLNLVHSSAPIDIESSKKAIKLYKNFLIKNFGIEKLEYIEHLYSFKLDAITSLTPEHIYRINVGLTNLEYQDLDLLLEHLHSLREQLKGFDEEELKEPLDAFLQKDTCLLGREAKGLHQYFAKANPLADLSDLHSWLMALPDTTKSQELPIEIFSEILPIIHFSDEEKKKALTGREIFGFIRSGYTNAGLGQYKPWVDQHQLTQFYPELIQNSSMTSYYEKLAHVVVKVHLAREHPTEGFRVGALIPAPPSHAGGPLRWYKVTSCVSNSYGIFSITLESACNDPSLPAIKLYRSTASSRYALHSQSTVTNDLNNFNAPGYQGIGLTDKYEEKFFKDRTIPVWLGYNIQAQNDLENDSLIEAVQNLRQAENALLEEFNQNHRIKSLKEIIQGHDFLLNDLERKMHPMSCFLALFKCGKLSKKWDYARLYQQLVKSYILKKKIKNKNAFNPRKDAREMRSILRKIYKLENSESTKLKIKLLIQDIDNHILTNHAQKKRREALDELNQSIYFKLRDQRIELETAINAQDPNALEMANLLTNEWNNYAEDCGESLDQKIPGGVVMCGHSLGGACAQSHTVRWFTEKNRMPLPGNKCSLYEFDSPATNKAQNKKFLNWGTAHSSLFKNMFEIIRRQEAGDVVVTAGEEHLGAVRSKKQEEEISSWLRFDAAVLKRNPDSKHFPICLPLTAHETRFLEGKSINTFYTRNQLLELQKEWLAKSGDPNQQKALSQIQLLLNIPKDYICTYYTPLTQGLFNRQGDIEHKNIDEAKDFQKQFYSLKTKLWNLQRFMDPNTAEQARKSVSLFWSIIRKLLVRGQDTYKLNPKYTDKMGNFAVGLSGVMAKQNFHSPAISASAAAA